MNVSQWKKFKKSGSYHRSVQKYRSQWGSTKSDKNLQKSTYDTAVETQIQLIGCTRKEINVSVSEEDDIYVTTDDHLHNWDVELYNDDDENTGGNDLHDDNIETESLTINEELKSWALTHNITHTSLRELLMILKKSFKELPLDPRTLLKTPETVNNVIKIKGGQYWHHGLSTCLKQYFLDLDKPMCISLNISIDGLPLFKSSKQEFWPILANIQEVPQCKVFAIGIYCGAGKPGSPVEFLRPFVDELKPILSNGIVINAHKLSVTIRCFICDSPARSLVKGVAYFNSQHGCQKCTTIGEYNWDGRTNVFPRLECPKRTDEDFRQHKYGGHHRFDSPILELPVNMIKQFPIGDSLHLIDLGVMKKLLVGWNEGKLGFSTKWNYEKANLIPKKLKTCKMPKEIHRAVRGLDEIAHWKGLEYRTFLLYLSPIILKGNLPQEYYDHFLHFFCAITICSSVEFTEYLDVAHDLLHDFVENFISIYGARHITSNMHNLMHLVDDVRMFGILSEFSSYPFESCLFRIKKLLRTGKDPLIQVAKRMTEWNTLKNSAVKYSYPKFKCYNNGAKLKEILPDFNDFFYKVEMESYVLNAEQFENQWILTKNKEIVRMINSVVKDNETFIYGSSLKGIQDFFDIPFKSLKSLNL